MNATIIKEVWHGSWEMRLLIVAGLITGLTAGDIAPFIMWMPDWIEGLIASYWNVAILALVAWIRAKKTSSKLVLTAAEADAPEVVKAAKAATKESVEVRELKARLATLEGDSPKA